MRRAARVDATQAEIVQALREEGCKVYVIGLPVDLLVGKAGKTLLVEVKTPTGRYTDLQVRFLSEWTGGPVATIRDVEGARRAARMLDEVEQTQ